MVFVNPRNNTNFAIKLLEFYRENKWDEKWDFLKYWQNIVRIYLAEVDSGGRGLLLDISMGLGKSLAAVAIAMEFVGKRGIIMLMAKSIQTNMHGAIEKYVRLRGAADPDYPPAKLSPEELNSWIGANFSFVSLNAGNMLGQVAATSALDERLKVLVEDANLDGKLIIVDEAHNLFRAITHGSKNALGFYDLAMKARGAKFVFLTGTPIANDPFELVPAFNMLAGETLFPEDYAEFHAAYVEEGGVKNKGRFQNRIYGLVSYVDHGSTQGAGVGASHKSTAEFPADLGAEVIRLPMAGTQWLHYREAREKELAEASKPAGRRAAVRMAIPKSARASTYRVRSRQFSNYVGPAEPSGEEWASPKFRAIWERIEAAPTSLHVIYSQFKGLGGLKPLANYFIHRGAKPYGEISWEEPEPEPEMPPVKIGGWLDELDNYVERWGGGLGDLDDDTVREVSSAEELRRLGLSIGPSQKVLRCGYEFVVLDRTRRGWKVQTQSAGSRGIQKIMAEVAKMEIDGGAEGQIVFAAITGDMPVAERQKIVDIYTDPANAHGEKILVLLITSTGAESLDLKNVRFVHILEPYWTYGRIQQVKFRGIRNDSHVALPPEEKNVKTFIYLATAPAGEEGKTTDEEIYEDSLRAYANITPFISAIREVSIECSINAESWCRVCAPTNAPLYSSWVKDLSLADPCVPYVEKKIEATKITVDGKEYHYSPSNSVFGYAIYKLDKQLAKYMQLPENGSEFMRVLDAIEQPPTQ
jgi:hypothetical protein